MPGSTSRPSGRNCPNCQFSELLIANYDMAERAHATTQINLFDFQKGEFDETYVF